MSNSVQMKHVLNQGQPHSFYGSQLFFGIISILMCTTIGKFHTECLIFFSCFRFVSFHFVCCPSRRCSYFPLPGSRLYPPLHLSLHATRSLAVILIDGHLYSFRSSPSRSSCCAHYHSIYIRYNFFHHDVHILRSSRKKTFRISLTFH